MQLITPQKYLGILSDFGTCNAFLNAIHNQHISSPSRTTLDKQSCPQVTRNAESHQAWQFSFSRDKAFIKFGENEFMSF
jgi:hypothetical protein